MSSVFVVQILFILIYARRKPIVFPQKIILAGLVVILLAFLWDSAYFGPLFRGLILFSMTQPLMVTFSLFMATATVLDTIRQSTEREVRLAKYVEVKERELLEARIDIMLSQIQPHFLYNILTTIETLCRKDGQQAASLVNNFSCYLRDNMESLNQKELVPFDRELEHTKVYLAIEKMRYKDRFDVEFDLAVTDFYLPILTVQPLVENAVRHGVTKNSESVTICIVTQEVTGGVQITVTDNGVGFDPSQSSDSEYSHIGLANVRNRLAAQCGGTLTIESSLGIGTTATLYIPSEKEENS